jgi:hypothetical protein
MSFYAILANHDTLRGGHAGELTYLIQGNRYLQMWTSLGSTRRYLVVAQKIRNEHGGLCCIHNSLLSLIARIGGSWVSRRRISEG